MLLIQLPDGTVSEVKGCKFIWIDDEEWAMNGTESLSGSTGIVSQLTRLIDPLPLPNFVRIELERLRAR